MVRIHKSETAYSVTVSSRPLNGTMTVWALREFVQALEDAEIPGEALLIPEQNHDTKHFSGLRVRHTVVVEPAPEDGAP